MTSPSVEVAADAVRAAAGREIPKVAVVLGSGLGEFADGLERSIAIAYADIPGFPRSTVTGHAGRLVLGEIAGAQVACMQGRQHLYEGHAAADLAFPVRVLKRLGVEILVLTNAAGGLRPDMVPGTIMVMTDHINLTARNPLIGPNDDAFGPRFFDMSQAYDPQLRSLIEAAAEVAGVAVSSGVYVQAPGPNFETPAEVRAFRILGGDAVGMSTVPEVLVARHCGMRVAGLSLITNLAAGLAGHALSHEETLSEAGKAAGRMTRLLTAFLPRAAPVA